MQYRSSVVRNTLCQKLRAQRAVHMFKFVHTKSSNKKCSIVQMFECSSIVQIVRVFSKASSPSSTRQSWSLVSSSPRTSHSLVVQYLVVEYIGSLRALHGHIIVWWS